MWPVFHKTLSEQKENDDDEDRDKLKDIRRLKWKKKLEEPSRKMLKTEFEGGKKRPEEEEEEEEGERTEDKISSLEYFLTKSTPNLDLSCSVRDTLNLLSVFGLYPNLAISDPVNTHYCLCYTMTFNTLSKNNLRSFHLQFCRLLQLIPLFKFGPLASCKTIFHVLDMF